MLPSATKPTCPAYLEPISEIHRTEPYVYSQMVAGKDAPHPWRSKKQLAHRYRRLVFQQRQPVSPGIVPTMDGLRIDPCLPGSLGGFHAERRYRGAVYQITVRQSAGVEHGVAHITCDGVPVSGTVLPIAEPGRTDEVIVEMGE